MSRNFKVLLAALLVVLVAGGAYAFAASNTVAPSSAGYGISTVSGYTVGQVVYDLNDDNPTLVSAINFDIAPKTGTVVASIVKIQTTEEGNWKDCSIVGQTELIQHITCTYPFPGTLQLNDIDKLNVIASSSTNPVDETH